MILKKYNRFDFQEYKKIAGNNYANEISKANGISLDEAKAKSEEQFNLILPDGLETKNQFFFKCIKDNEEVGMVWFCLYNDGKIKKAFIYDFYVWTNYRNNGYSKKIMSLVESEARAMGAKAIGLHVFVHNEIAYGIYQKLGYGVTEKGESSVEMEKFFEC